MQNLTKSGYETSRHRKKFFLVGAFFKVPTSVQVEGLDSPALLTFVWPHSCRCCRSPCQPYNPSCPSAAFRPNRCHHYRRAPHSCSLSVVPIRWNWSRSLSQATGSFLLRDLCCPYPAGSKVTPSPMTESARWHVLVSSASVHSAKCSSSQKGPASHLAGDLNSLLHLRQGFSVVRHTVQEGLTISPACAIKEVFGSSRYLHLVIIVLKGLVELGQDHSKSFSAHEVFSTKCSIYRHSNYPSHHKIKAGQIGKTSKSCQDNRRLCSQLEGRFVSCQTTFLFHFNKLKWLKIPTSFLSQITPVGGERPAAPAAGATHVVVEAGKPPSRPFQTPL